MKKLYKFDLFFKEDRKKRITSGYVVADSIEMAKKELAKSFNLDSGKYVTNFDLGDSYIAKPYFQDDRNDNVFIEEFLKDLE